MKAAGAPATTALISQAAAWRLASLLLERPQSQWLNDIAQLAVEVNEQKLRHSAEAAKEATEELYQCLFGPGGAISPREVSYCGMEDPGQVMAQLANFYEAFSFTPRREESIDHIAVEAGFVGYLLLKEAYAEMQGDDTSAGITQQARKRFLDEHLQRCAQGMINWLDDLPPYLHDVLSWLAATRFDPVT